jgi:hypothetical protein
MPIKVVPILAMLAALTLLVHARGLRKRTDNDEWTWMAYNQTITPQIAELFSVVFRQLEEEDVYIPESECRFKRDQLELVEYYRSDDLDGNSGDVLMVYYCNVSRKIQYLRASEKSQKYKWSGESLKMITESETGIRQLYPHVAYKSISQGKKAIARQHLLEAMNSSPLFEHCTMEMDGNIWDKAENEWTYWKAVVDILCKGLPPASGEVEFSRPRSSEAASCQILLVGFNFIPETIVSLTDQMVGWCVDEDGIAIGDTTNGILSTHISEEGCLAKCKEENDAMGCEYSKTTRICTRTAELVVSKDVKGSGHTNSDICWDLSTVRMESGVLRVDVGTINHHRKSDGVTFKTPFFAPPRVTVTSIEFEAIFVGALTKTGFKVLPNLHDNLSRFTGWVNWTAVGHA